MLMSLSHGSAAMVWIPEACKDTDGAVHLVMDLCEGGELFDRIFARGRYSECAAANIFRTTIDVFQLCHSNGMIHRHLKLENFLFVNKSEDSLFKVIDFGLSVFFKPGDWLTEVVGRVIHGAGGAEAELLPRGGHLYCRRHPLHTRRRPSVPGSYMTMTN